MARKKMSETKSNRKRNNVGASVKELSSKSISTSSVRDITSLADRLVSVTDLGRGKAASVVSHITKDKKPFLILKNNKPKAAIIDIDQLNELLEDQENYRLLLLVQNRMKNYDENKTYSHTEVLEELNITEEEIRAVMDEVEIE